MLIDFDQSSGKLLSSRTFAESERALAEKARLDLELALHAAGNMREVVILRARDEAQIRRTHRRYFETWEELLT
ncbi:MAG: hypothetical protein AB7F83_03720 [Lysobacterales bacterium]